MEYLTQSISNNIIQQLVNSNMNIPNSMNKLQINSNINNISTNKQHNIDIFRIEKNSHKNTNKIFKEKDSNNLNNKYIQYQRALQKRKDNINKFLFNYRLNNSKLYDNSNNKNQSKTNNVNNLSGSDATLNNISKRKIEFIGKKGLIDKNKNNNNEKSKSKDEIIIEEKNNAK